MDVDAQSGDASEDPAGADVTVELIGNRWRALVNREQRDWAGRRRYNGNAGGPRAGRARG